MTRAWLDLPAGDARGLPPMERRELVDAVLRDRVVELAAARSAAFPPGVPHLPALRGPAT